jgi:glucose-1-phosphate cytidylyltransferase
MPHSVATHDIPVVILCGGMGTRLREASEKLPKPLVDIGGRPILWHIMKTYEAHGFRRFVLALGYKSELIKQYFLDYRHLTSDFTLRLGGNHEPVFHDTAADVDWEITFVETGLTSGTAARIRRVAQHLDAPRFALTYGDGIGDVDVTRSLEHHVQSDLLGTLTGVHPGSRYGEMRVQGTTVVEFNEKPTLAEGWVNGGFFLFEREFVEKYIPDYDSGLMLESSPLQQLARDRQLSVFEHEGFWMGMDTFRDWTELNTLWDRGVAPWKTWED